MMKSIFKYPLLAILLAGVDISPLDVKIHLKCGTHVTFSNVDPLEFKEFVGLILSYSDRFIKIQNIIIALDSITLIESINSNDIPKN